MEDWNGKGEMEKAKENESDLKDADIAKMIAAVGERWMKGNDWMNLGKDNLPV
jgi:hypothetical protein